VNDERAWSCPNQGARALRTGRASNIAAIVPDIAKPFFPPLIRAAQILADEKRFATFLGSLDEKPERGEYPLTTTGAT
jgi:LacI family transcriptional regulator